MEKMVVVNESSLISDEDLRILLRAAKVHFSRDFCPAHGIDPSRFDIVDARSLRASYAGQIVVRFSDNPPQPGIEGYHFVEEHGNPGIEIFVKPTLDAGLKVYEGPGSVLVTLTHEIAEYAIDRFANQWLDTNGTLRDGEGRIWKQVAAEVADPVEDTFYDVVVQDAVKGNVKRIYASCSNFVLPAWSNPYVSLAKRDFMGLLDPTKAFGMTEGGYLIVRNVIGKETNLFAKGYPSWKLNKKERGGSRSYRRLLESRIMGYIDTDGEGISYA